MNKFEKLKKQAQCLPNLPGVYSYHDQDGLIIYIGKAKNLRKRVASYFNKDQNLKTCLLLNSVCEINYTITPTEIDALTLEDKLISQHQPRYNILLKDDSSYRYICITSKNPPQITVARKPNKQSYCLGPFPFSTHQIANVARDILGLTKYHQLTTNNWQLYLEAANFNKNQSQSQPEEIYRNFINQLIKTIKYSDQTLITRYQKLMFDHSYKLEFEQALQYRNKIELLQKLAQRTSQITPNTQNSEHFINLIQHHDQLLIFLFSIQNGLLHLIKKFSFDAHSPFNILNAFLKQYYGQNTPPNKVNIYQDLNNQFSLDPLINDYLSLKWNTKTKLALVNKHRLLPLAQQNIAAKLQTKNHLANDLKQLLKLNFSPQTIDFIDISNLSDIIIVGGVVRFTNGEPIKTLWRHYTIKTTNGQDDYASISETILRRYRTITHPDVLVVDGGLGQLNAAQIFLPANAKTFLVGLAKKEEMLIFQDQEPIKLSLHNSAGRFLIKGRDTVHNFVIAHTRTVFHKYYKKSWLDQIPGIGPITKIKLLKHFKSIDLIQNAKFDELANLIGPAKAKIVQEFDKKRASPLAANDALF